MTKSKSSAVLHLFGIALLIFTGFLFNPLPVAATEASQAKYRVLKVLDGDTIVVADLGKVRYIGVNTPELHHPAKGKEPYSEEALAANQQLVAGKDIRLEYDLQRHDKYGRTLAYVYADKVFVNARLLADGLGRAMPIKPNLKHARYFYNLQQQAKLAEKGIWSK